MSMDKISIVIPAFNAEDTIERAVRSAVEQTWENTEIIVVDDGSYDRTPEVLRELEKELPRLTVIRQANSGVSSARNTGIAAASGRWLLTLDDDDYVDGNMLSGLHACAENGCDLAICGMKLVYPDHTEAFSCGEALTDTRKNFLDQKMLRLYDNHLLTTHANKLYDMDIIRRERLRYDPELQINEDIDFVLRYLRCCGRIGCISGTYLNYVQHGTGESLVSTFRENGVRSSVRLAETLDALLAETGTDREVSGGMHQRMLVHVLSFAGLMYSRSSMSDGEKLAAIRGLAEDPAFRRLLKETEPDGVKTAAAKFLLSTGQYRIYHGLCRLIYRTRKTGAEERT